MSVLFASPIPLKGTANAVELTRGKATVKIQKSISNCQPVLKESQFFVKVCTKGELHVIERLCARWLYKVHRLNLIIVVFLMMKSSSDCKS